MRIVEQLKQKGFNKTIWKKINKAMQNYNMIKENDRILLGISGGKDSILLFNTLIRLKHIVNFNFEIFPVHFYNTSLNLDGINIIVDHIKKYGYDLKIIDSNIGKIIEEKQTKSPCSLCSRVRRGTLYAYMKEQNLNKLALGHHLDDIIETYFMNLVFQGNTSIMRPMYFSKEHHLEVIRPLAYVEEKDVIEYIRKGNFPVFKENCIYIEKKVNMRDNIKPIIESFEKLNKDVRATIKKSLNI